MTTIAYKSGILAADTQLTFDNSIKSSCHKIITIRPGYVYAAVGDPRDDANFSYYLEKCEEATEPRDVERPTLKKDFECIGIRDGIPFFADKNGVLTILTHPYYAIGSGWQLALAAMVLGMSAEDAVKFAAELDIYTSQPIDIYDSTKDPKKIITRRKTRAKRTTSPTKSSEGS